MIEKEDLRIVFMGTPEFAVESLKALIDGGYNVVAVVTMPDKPAGRGHKLQASAVKQYAQSTEIPILQPTHLKDEFFLQTLQAFRADLQVVVAFRMLPEIVWNMPKYGTFNLHASLLPQYRGAAPINWAIINGEQKTGVTTFFLTHEIDTGKIIRQEAVPIDNIDNIGTLYQRLMLLGATVVTQTVDDIRKGNPKTTPQNQLIDPDTPLRPAPKIYKETCQLQFDLSVQDAHNFVRGLSPYPVAWCQLQYPNKSEKIVTKLYQTDIEIATHSHNIGSLIIDKKSAKIALKDGYLHILSLQTAGKKRMQIADFLNGLR